MEIAIISFMVCCGLIVLIALVLSIGFSKGEEYVKTRQIDKIKKVLSQDLLSIEEKLKRIEFIIEIGED